MVNLDFGTVSVDQAFTVKGIGTVALGVVKAGTVKKHDVLRALPGSGRAEVRSIQKHDDDFDTAEPGDHVGVALKGVESDDLPRGTVLTDDSSMMVTQRTDAELTLNAYWAQLPHAGMVVQVGYWMQFNVARVSQAEPLGGRRHRLTLEMEKPLVHPTGSSAALTYTDGGKLRVMGAITLP